MAIDPRAALDRLVGALEAHLAAAQRRHGENDPGVEAAYKSLADAFEAYDESLYEAHDEVTPFVLYDDVEDDRDDDGDDDEDDDEDDGDEEDFDDEEIDLDDAADAPTHDPAAADQPVTGTQGSADPRPAARR